MTEKEFRKIVAITEMSQQEKKEIIDELEKIMTVVKEELPNYLNLKNIYITPNLKSGLLLKDEKDISSTIVIDLNNNDKKSISKKVIFNTIENILLLNIDEEIIRSDNFKINFKSGLKLKINVVNDENRYNIVDKLNNDYPLFSNTIRILKYFIKEEKIELDTDIIIILLGYSLQNHLVDNRYEGYIQAFIKGIDDFVSGSFVSLEKYYSDYNRDISYENKSEYSIIDFNTDANLTKNISINELNDYRKIKKTLQKLTQVVDVITNNKEIIIDINPVYNSETKNYNWSYNIENLNISNVGKEYLEQNLLDANLRALQKALKIIVDKGLKNSQITIRTKIKNILEEKEDMTNESKSRLKAIKNLIEENKLKIK